MKNISKTIAIIIVFFALTNTLVHAGGSNVRIVPLSNGIAKGQGAEVMLTVFDPYKNKLDMKDLERYSYDGSKFKSANIGIEDVEVKIGFQDSSAEKQCEMKEKKTNKYGQIRATCYSDKPGQYTVQAKFRSDAPLCDGCGGANTYLQTTTITFDQKPEAPKVLAPVPTTKPTAVPVVTKPIEETKLGTTTNENTAPQNTDEMKKENEQLKKQIEDLNNKVNRQESEISTMKKIISQIQEFFGKLFGRK